MKTNIAKIGPGILVAATGIGAGDMVAATVGGASFGYIMLWAVLAGAVFKYVLNEGLARWQLFSGKSLINEWIELLHPAFSWYFLFYQLFWSFIVFAALMAACGLAAYTLTGVLNVTTWGIIHSVIALFLVLNTNYSIFENIMKALITLMFTVVIISLVILNPPLDKVILNMINTEVIPGAATYALAIIGGVGGSLTLLSYSYWIKEKKWNNPSFLKTIKLDLKVAYLLTAVFGIALVIIASDLKPEVVKGNGIILALADKIGDISGVAAKWVFLLGFWGAVFSSMLGVWQSVPLIFSDFTKSFFKSKDKNSGIELSKSNEYKYFLIFMAFFPAIFLFLGKPVWIIIVYSVIGSMFMPFLAAVLIILNNKFIKAKEGQNTLLINIILVFNFVLFAYLAVKEIFKL